MARLDFDFHARPSRPGMLGIALMLASVTVLGWILNTLQTARATEAGLVMEIAALEQPYPEKTGQSALRVDTTAYTARTDIAAQLAYSWQPAFDALAAARNNRIALVSLDAAQEKSQIKLVAEARHLADAITFIQTLQQQPGIKRAALTQHAIQMDNAQQPVRFTVLVELDT